MDIGQYKSGGHTKWFDDLTDQHTGMIKQPGGRKTLMGSLRYLNTVLTLIAILLTLNCWTMWGGTTIHSGPTFMSTATAATQSRSPGGIPNASVQRKKIIDLLQELNGQNKQLLTMFYTGQAKVETVNAQAP